MVKILFILHCLLGWNLELLAIEKISQNFNQHDFQGKKIENTVFIDCQFNFANFKNAQLVNVKFIKSQLIDAQFNQAKLTNVSFEQSNLGGANFQKSQIENLSILFSQAPKLSFWKAHAKNLIIKGSYVFALDLSLSNLDHIIIQKSFLEDSILAPLKLNKGLIEESTFETATLLSSLTNLKQIVSVNFKLPEEIKVLKAPEISSGCLKRYPLNKNRSNGIGMLTNGAISGGCFNSCLNFQEYELDIDLSLWPENLQEQLSLEIIFNQDASTITSDLKYHSKAKSLFFPLKKETKKMNFILKGQEEFGIFEMRLTIRGNE